ncbi:TPA: hypothetical protein ACLAPU_001730 [Neisseria meningitidis]
MMPTIFNHLENNGGNIWQNITPARYPDRRNLDKPKQPVYWIWDMENPLADSIKSFIYKLFENPNFLNEI